MSSLKTDYFSVKYSSWSSIRCKRNTFIEKYIPPEFFVVYYDASKDIGYVFNPVLYAITGKKKLTYLIGFSQITKYEKSFYKHIKLIIRMLLTRK